MSIVSSFRRECSDQAGSDMKVSGWPDGIGHGGAEPLNICSDHTTAIPIGEGWRSAGAAYAIVVLDKRSADPGPITTGLGLAKIRGLPTSCHKLLLGVMGPGFRQDDGGGVLLRLRRHSRIGADRGFADAD